MNLKNEIQSALVDNVSLAKLKLILKNFKESGGTREEAHTHLYELLQEASTSQEDEYLRELLDYTIGFSGKIATLWD
jgi:hypothetical protein